MENKIFKAKVMHNRLHPKKHFFWYNVLYLSLNINNLSINKPTLFSINKFNLFSFYNKNYGFKDNQNPMLWLKNILEQNKIINFIAVEKTQLITMPSVFGYVFNPISFWICYNKNNEISAIVYEVNNTFGDSYSYCIHKDIVDNNLPIINNNDELIAKKILHVSPFFTPIGEYIFKFYINNNNINIFINYFINNKLMLKTSLCGNLINFSSYNLLKHFIMYPLPNLRVIFLIHYHAIILFLKKIKFYGKNSNNINNPLN
jgi:DUF1365 family protein